MKPAIDHIVIGAATLEQGARYVKDKLGVAIPFGGIHEKMGTHNHLMQLGTDCFLEVIAVNPEGNPPDQPRWYGLDDPYIRHQLEQQPRLLSWVINTDNIQQLLQQASVPMGTPTRISRGVLSWLFGLPEDGRLLAAGILPYVIEWQCNAHPANNMANSDCTLAGLSLYHTNAIWLETILASIGAQHLVTVYPLADQQTPYIEARINTPTGQKTLSSKLD